MAVSTGTREGSCQEPRCESRGSDLRWVSVLSRTCNREVHSTLVTRVGVDQRFTVQDLRTMHFHHNPHTSRFSVSGSNHQHYQQAGLGLPGQFSHYQHHTHAFPNQPMAPSLFFLFTSMDKAYEPWWSETPAYSPPLQGANRPEFRAKAFANLER